MLKYLSSINWLAVLAATFVYYALGAAWGASPLGQLYYQALGFEAPQGWTPGAGMYVVPLAGCLAASVVTAILARATDRKTFFQGLELGVVVGLGYAAAVAGMDAAAPHNVSPGTIFAILSVYHVAGLAIVGGIVAAWRKHR